MFVIVLLAIGPAHDTLAPRRRAAHHHSDHFDFNAPQNGLNKTPNLASFDESSPEFGELCDSRPKPIVFVADSHGLRGGIEGCFLNNLDPPALCRHKEPVIGCLHHFPAFVLLGEPTI